MARTRRRGTLVDYLVAAIEPALIITMVGSLMFFLLDMWYDGPVIDRLRWILFWFVLGIVLITRVSMQIGTNLALGYGVALGGAVALVASVLAGFQPALLVIMGVVWWATHRLTFDCTLLDEDQDAGVGLLQETGLDPESAAEPIPATPAPTDDDPAAMDTSLLPHHPWWKPGKQDSDEARRPNAPGTWLIYFTLVSLPLFGLGQWLVPAVEEERRSGLFFYFLAYISSAMGLLLATSFLNLRRYLRQRKLSMPGAMTATWLSTGAIVIVGLTLLAAALPLPGLAWNVIRGSTPASSDLRASNSAILKDSGVQGEGTQSEGPAGSKGAKPPTSSGKEKGSGQTNDPNATQQTGGKGRAGGKNAPGNSKSGAPRGKSAPSKGGAQGKQGSPQQNKGDSGNQNKGQDGQAEKQAERSENADQKASPDDKNAADQDNEKSSQEKQDSNDASSPPSRLPSVPFAAPWWLRALFVAAGVAALIYGLLRYGMTLLYALRDLLASLFGGLFIQQPKKRTKAPDPAPNEQAPPLRPFASFANPFDTGLDQRFSPNDLVIYSFEALEAWALEHKLGRSPDETPSEFVRRLGDARAELRQDATRLVGYFVTIVYGQKGFQNEVLPPLQQFWHALQRVPA
jgi:Domain of unknown function (DUF4129)